MGLETIAIIGAVTSALSTIIGFVISLVSKRMKRSLKNPKVTIVTKKGVEISLGGLDEEKLKELIHSISDNDEITSIRIK